MQYTKKLYDIMASALKKAADITKEQDYERLRTVDEEYEIEIVERLKAKFPDMYDRNTRNVSEISEWRLEQSTLIRDLVTYLDYVTDKDELIFLVKALDSFLEDTFYECIPIEQEEYRFICLNENYKECETYLLPRVICSWEHKNRDAYTSYTIFYYLRNFYYFFQSDVRNYRIENILMPKGFFWEAIRRGELRVMVSPVTGEPTVEITEPYTENGSRFVSIQPMKPDREKRVKEKVLKVLQQAACEEADILVFPEMLGTEEITEEISCELGRREHIPDNTFPVLTICPTIWKDHSNFSRVLNDIGELICEQQKHYGVILSDEICGREKENQEISSRNHHYIKEDIRSDRKIYILHCHEIGRIAVAICKDFLITEYLKILAEKLKVSLVMVLSFTRSDHQFELVTPKYGILDCNVIWINTCSARWLSEKGEMSADVTRAFLPGKKGVEKQRKGIGDFCKMQCRCEEECIHTYRIRLDMEEKE